MTKHNILAYKKQSVAILAVLMAFCLTGCRNTSKLTHDKSPSQQASKPAAECVEISRCETLIANFSCTVDDIAVNGQLRLRRDSVIWVNLNKFIELGRAKLTRDSVFVYAKIAGRYFEGTYSDLQKVAGITTDFESLQELFLGEKDFVRESWVMADFSDWRQTVEVLDDGSMVKNKKYPYRADISARSKLYSGTATILYSKVKMNQPTTYPYSVSPVARKYEVKK